MNRRLALAAAALLAAAAAGAAPPPAAERLLAQWRTAGPFSAERGAALWRRTFPGPDGRPRACTSCHGDDLTRPGRHVRTGERIDPMAPSANPERLTDAGKIGKWLHRNCRWVLGRVCTAREKGDLVTFLSRQ
ncbi:DUF1924 domain-containing protein [Inmirania thermothiophila]|uniref:Uncharacterized protein DUF1924 n=1 Tax=Inmirania thermothiophila TaxID=1750597 RepID=A0A3N1Y751_9GAMM|nr:DUF1924 domain-containing protein [Inmirania thermothiophila]ROR34643.1 uncharacterized protein DUF1924 [Inmirania thermothiophila]